MTDSQRQSLSHAKRAGARAYLRGLGMVPAVADLWLGAWDATMHPNGDRDNADFWDRGARWAATAWKAGQVPPTIER